MKGLKLRGLVSMKKTLLSLLGVTPQLVCVLCLLNGCATTNGKGQIITHSKEPAYVFDVPYSDGTQSPERYSLWAVYLNGEDAFCYYLHRMEDNFIYRVYLDHKGNYLIFPTVNSYEIIKKKEIISESEASAIIYRRTGYATYKEFVEAKKQADIERRRKQQVLDDQKLKEKLADQALGVEELVYSLDKLSEKLRGNFRVRTLIKIAGKINSETYIFHVGHTSSDEEIVVRGKNLENCGAKVIYPGPDGLPFPTLDFRNDTKARFLFDAFIAGYTYGWVLKLIGTTTVITKAGFYREVPLYEFVGINSEAIYEVSSVITRDGSIYWY